MTASKLLVKREGDFHYPICFEEDFSNLAQVMKWKKDLLTEKSAL